MHYSLSQGRHRVIKRLQTVSYIILLIEIVCLFVNFYVPSKRKADHWHEPIIIPDNMQLTLTDDEQFQTLGGDTYTVPGGTISVPIQINYNSVAFYYDEVADIKYTVSFDNIKEKAQLMDLRKVAEDRNREVRSGYMLRGIVLGLLFGVILLVVGAVLMRVCLKKKSKALIIIMHIIALACVFSLLYLSGALFFEH